MISDLCSRAKRRNHRATRLLFRPGRQSECHPLERLEAELRRGAEGNIATALREAPSWALIANLRMDPYEKGMKEGGGAMEFLGRNMWLLVPIQARSRSSSPISTSIRSRSAAHLNASNINYGFLQQQAALSGWAMERIKPR
jgi:hypothetical protein